MSATDAWVDFKEDDGSKSATVVVEYHMIRDRRRIQPCHAHAECRRDSDSESFTYST